MALSYAYKKLIPEKAIPNDFLSLAISINKQTCSSMGVTLYNFRDLDMFKREAKELIDGLTLEDIKMYVRRMLERAEQEKAEG